MSARLVAFGLVVLVGLAAPARAQVCYSMPFPASSITQHWRAGGHKGTDFSPTPHPVPAIADGRVALVLRDGESTCHGNVIVITHADGRASAYAHLARIDVSVGDLPRRGDYIGIAGASGNCTSAVHLHLGMSPASDLYGFRTSNNMDPIPYINAHSVCRPDRDGDGSYEGDDCDDGDARRTPGRAEGCDAIDNDCDSATDEGVARVCGVAGGACREGTETCTAGTFGACIGSIDPVDETCGEDDDDCDGAIDEARVCEHEAATLAAARSPSASSDIDGDGRADVCMRTADGFECVLAAPFGFDGTLVGPRMADEDGFDEPRIYGSVRMGDVDGDGRDDVCARDGDRFRCWRASATGFLTTEAWLSLDADPDAVSAEVWLADVDGDGVADLCARGVEGLSCRASARGELEVLEALSDEEGFDDVGHHGTIRFGDVNGDGRDDVCARDGDTFSCWLAEGDGFGARRDGPRWTAAAWDAVSHWSTLRVTDVDGDGRDDVCGRASEGFQCWLATEDGFDEPIRGPAMAEDGWDQPSQYTTIALEDVDGDGRRDVCAREADGVRCWLFGGRGFEETLRGPELSDAEGWSAPARFGSIRLADVSGDGLFDVCARDEEGVACWLASGHDFGRLVRSRTFTDASGASSPARSASFIAAGPHAEAPSASGCACGVTRRGSPLGLAALGLLALVLRRYRRGS